MRAIFQIAFNDIRLFLKDKFGYVWLFLAPIGFVYFTGVAGNGPQRDPANPRPSVVIDNQDLGFLGAVLMEEMDAQGMRVLDPEATEKPDRKILIPTNFTAQVRAKTPVKIEYLKVEGSGEESATMIEMRLLQATLGMNAHLVEWATQNTNQIALDEASLRAVIGKDDPVQLTATFAGRKTVPSGYEQSLPGNLIMFLMMNVLIFGGTSIAAERQNGVLRRLATQPVTRWQIIAGKVMGRFLLGCVVIVFFLALGQLAFGVRVAQAPGPILVTLFLFAWLAASLGVLIGSVTSNPDKTIGLCVLLSMIMGALGGCWWPLEVVSETMNRIGHLFPTAWAMDALHQLISFQGGFAEIETELAVLLGFAVVFNGLAARFLRYTEA